VSNVLTGRIDLSSTERTNLLVQREKELVEGIDLIDGVRMRRISKEDLEDFKNSIFPLPSDKVASLKTFVLEKYITTKDGHDFQLDQIMQNTILAMRLLKKGNVSGNCVFYILVSETREKFVSVEWSCEGGYRTLERWSFGKYDLSFDEIPALKKKLSQIQSIDFAEKKRLSLACKRFQRAYEEGDYEDQLIDFMIAFEALFVGKDVRGASKREKISIGCSDLVGETGKEKGYIVSFLSKAYSLRNLVVHAADYKVKDEYEIPRVVSETEDLLRKALNKLID